jgi:hypothetical protein
MEDILNLSLPERANCLIGALIIRRHLKGGRILWRPGWSEPGQALSGFLQCPWGHFRVLAEDGSSLSYSPERKDLSPLGQLWFKGRLKSRPPRV